MLSFVKEAQETVEGDNFFSLPHSFYNLGSVSNHGYHFIMGPSIGSQTEVMMKIRVR
jgi:hypothetical protein